MSGTASVPNTFASAVTATGQQLDTNYASIINYLNDPTNRNLFGTDTGTGGTYTVAITPPLVGGYTAGAFIQFQAVNASSAAAQVNISGLGNLPIQNNEGHAVLASDISAGGIVNGVVKGGTAFVMVSSTPSKAIAKCWGNFNGTFTGTITAGSNAAIQSFGVSKAVKTGTGTYWIVFNNAFLGSGGQNQYSAVASAKPTAGIAICQVNALNSVSFGITTFNASTAAADVTDVYFQIFGNLG